MTFGYIALFSWPLLAILLFQRFGLVSGIASTIIGGYLLLPSQPVINLPLIPAFNKDFIPALSALVLATIMARKQRTSLPQQNSILPGWLPRLGWVRLLLLALIGGAFGTMLLNTSGFSFGPRSLPGLRPYDAFSNVLVTYVGLIPFFLARKFLARPEDHQALLVVLCTAGLLYTLPTLYEVRMSPQLNRMIYGFFPNDWAQHVRDGGYRPLVFLHHGLWLAIFLCCAFLAALGMARVSEGANRMRWLVGGTWLLITIVLSKSLGALIIALVIAPVIFFLRLRTQMIFAGIIAGIVLVYPGLRGADLIPVKTIFSLAQKIDVNRADSLEYRFDNEDILLDKARQKPIFGWGNWGRARVFNDKGQDLSTTDGYWIIIIGEGGWIRYLSIYGLLSIASMLLAKNARTYEISKSTTALCLVLSANLIDTIPNAGVTPVTWLLAGAVMGRLELGRIRQGTTTGTVGAGEQIIRSRSPYSRQTRLHPAKSGSLNG